MNATGIIAIVIFICLYYFEKYERRRLEKLNLIYENHAIWAISKLNEVTGEEWYFIEKGIKKH